MSRPLGPRADEVLVEVAAAAVNNTDFNTRIGWHSKAITSDTGSGGESGFGSVGEDSSWSGAPLSFPRIQGADHTVDRGRDLTDALGADSVDVVLDLVGGPQWQQVLGVLRRGGRYAVAGAIGGPMVEADLRTIYLRDLTLFGCTFQPDEVFENPDRVRAARRDPARDRQDVPAGGHRAGPARLLVEETDRQTRAAATAS